ncbi:hypothetical protein ACU8NH_18170 [Rhizobium leguminosarum]
MAHSPESERQRLDLAHHVANAAREAAREAFAAVIARTDGGGAP